MIRDLLSGVVSQQDILNCYNAKIDYIQLPKSVNGFIFKYNGINNIFVNNSLSNYKKKKTILHELAHIELSQLERYDNDMFAFKIDKYEDEADKYIKSVLEDLKNEKNI